VVAAERGLTLKDLGWRRDRTNAVMLSAKLGHLLGINGFFSRLAVPAGQARLTEWWPEARCAATWKKFVQPDGYGRWGTAEQELGFFLEFDNGTEALARVTAKIDAYTRLAQATGISTPLLFHFPSPRREQNFRDACPAVTLPVLTTSSGPADRHPAGPVWAALHSDARRPLADFTRLPDRRRTGAKTTASALQPSAWATRPGNTAVAACPR
jgi:hypothetical protein